MSRENHSYYESPQEMNWGLLVVLVLFAGLFLALLLFTTNAAINAGKQNNESTFKNSKVYDHRYLIEINKKDTLEINALSDGYGTVSFQHKDDCVFLLLAKGNGEIEKQEEHCGINDFKVLNFERSEIKEKQERKIGHR